MKIIHYPELVSTNTLALELAGRGDVRHGTILYADRQTGGRGQYGRRFVSPAGGLYCSIIVRPELAPEEYPLLTLAAGVGCCRAVAMAAGISPQLKWPNDLYLHDQKLAGILSESAGSSSFTRCCPAAIIGIGMNVNSGDLPVSLQETTISLSSVTGRFFDLSSLVVTVGHQVLAAVSRLQENSSLLLAQWQQRDYLFAQRVRAVGCSGSMLFGVGRGIAADGRYRILADDGQEHRIVAGSIKRVLSVDGRFRV